MPFADVLARTTFDSAFSATDVGAITSAMRTAYDGSATARMMFDDWIADPTNTIQIDFGAGQFRAFLNTGRIEIDLSFLNNNNYIDNNGNAVEDTPVTAIVHEFVHAITGRRDNTNFLDYKGDTVEFSNIIYRELGLPEQNSYSAYDSVGNILTRGVAYTNGVEIDRSESGDRDLSSVLALFSDDLLIGGPSANTLESGLGDDFLFGAGGDDFLSGGIFGTDTAVLTGNPVDYDIRLNADGTWTSRHVRGSMDEGTDTFKNLEKVQFSGGQTFNLTKSGLTFQNDFAFVIDQTGSMSDDIAAVKSAATGVVNALFADNTVDARIGIVGFRDNTIGEPTSVILPFTDQDTFADRKTAAVNAINSISVGGGGDFPETAFDGLLKALDGTMGDWRIGAGTKKVALFTDASAKDAFLLPTVLGFASDIGATISASSTAALGSFGAVDTFELSFGDPSEGRDPSSEGDPPREFIPSDDPIQAPGGAATVQITTIFIETFISPDPSLTELSESTGGSVLTAANADEVVERLLEVVSSSNYLLAVDTPSVDEGDSGTTPVSFTISRDRSENASIVTLETTGTADGDDVSGVPISVSFDSGEVSKTFTVSVNGDDVVEDDEIFGLRIVDIDELSTFSSTPTEFVILNDDETSSLNEITGTENRDNLVGTGADDAIRSLAGSYDKMSGDAGADQFIFSDEATNGIRERDVILDYEVGIDSIVLEGSASVGSIRETSSSVVIFLEGDRDAIYVRGDGVTADNLSIITNDLFV